MALLPVSREENLRNSLKQFFLDACAPYNIPVQFDKTLSQPNLSGTEVTHWLSVAMGRCYYLNSRHLIDVFCNVCTRQDPEGCNNVRIADFVRGLLQDDEQTDGLARIQLLDFSKPTKPEIGTVLPVDISAGVETIFEDQTQVKQLVIRLWYAV